MPLYCQSHLSHTFYLFSNLPPSLLRLTMSAPPTAQGAANHRPSHRNGSRDVSASTEEPRFSSLYAERTEQTVLEELRRIKAQLKELSLRLPAAPELDEYECVDVRYMLRLASDEELVARLGVEGIRDALQKLGGPYLQIKSIRYIPKPSSPVLGSNGRMIYDRCASLLLIVSSYQAEYEIRNSSSRISEAISFSPNCFMLQRKYQVLVEDFDKDQNRGTFPDWTTFFRHYTQQSDIQVRVSFHRFLIETTSLQTALLICRMSIKIRFTMFKAMSATSTLRPKTNALTTYPQTISSTRYPDVLLQMQHARSLQGSLRVRPVSMWTLLRTTQHCQLSVR